MMDAWLITPPKWIRRLYPAFEWEVKTTNPIVYLTFDDGPTPAITEWVCNQLAQYNAKATFFCVGRHVEAHPTIMSQLLQHGHVVANHTWNHVNGWKTANKAYLEEVNKGEFALLPYSNFEKLFRPPYGKMSREQTKLLKEKGYSIVQWDFLTRDYNPSIDVATAMTRIEKSIKPGSILLFHDSEKAFPIIKQLLPYTLQLLQKKGFECKVLTQDLFLNQGN
ncbi:MAG: polysaccharide deacetylase family protein [Flavobacterium sp. BFFFF2]|nr:MAG: polysaccharide deacetylase family protein [Flavobacterium sp. BFFFF2]